MDRQLALELITRGREFHTAYRTDGFQRIYLGHLQSMLQAADKKCHDFKLREDRGKYAIVEYNTIKKIIDLGDQIIKDMENALDYCEKHNIKI